MLCGLHVIATPIRIGPYLEVQQLTLRSYEAVPRSHCAQRQLEASDCHAYDQNAEYEVNFVCYAEIAISCATSSGLGSRSTYPRAQTVSI